MRRLHDRRYATDYFVGNGIDIGCGPDPVGAFAHFFPLMTDCRAWDLKDGDAVLLEGIEPETFDFVHSSHSLEHMSDPYKAIARWIEVCKKGGHLIITLPDEDMFEQGWWPSPYAGVDHKNSWTIKKHQSWSPVSINVTDFFGQQSQQVEILKIELLNNTFNYRDPRWDQTRGPIQECAIEVILRKRTEDELNRKGRLPKEEFLTFKT
jgi:SAM-dependent methyltransferase